MASASAESAFDRVCDLVKKNTKKENLEEWDEFKKLKTILIEIIDINSIQNYIKSIDTDSYYSQFTNSHYSIIIEFEVDKEYIPGEIIISEIGVNLKINMFGNLLSSTIDIYLANKSYIKNYFNVFYALIKRDREYAELKKEYDYFLEHWL